MFMKTIYLDNGATTQLDPKVLEKMSVYYTEKYGNASSLHHKGQEAKMGLEEYRNLSDREIAMRCGVSNELVSSIRRQLSTADSSPSSATRLGKDGKRRRMPQRHSAGGDKAGSSTNSDAAPAQEASTTPATGSKQGEPNANPEEAISGDAQPKAGEKKPAARAFDIEKSLERILSLMYQEVRDCTPRQLVDLHRQVTFAANRLFLAPHAINGPSALVEIAQQFEETYQTIIAEPCAANTPERLATPVNPAEPSR